MPNHVESDLYVTPLNKEGRKQLAAFKKHSQSEDEDLCHNKFIPYPEHFAEADRVAPYPIIQKMSELYPDLRFTMKSYERGMGFKLHVVWENGKMIKSEEGRYNGNRGG